MALQRKQQKYCVYTYFDWFPLCTKKTSKVTESPHSEGIQQATSTLFFFFENACA